MPFDLGHDAAQLAPTLRLIGEAGVVPHDPFAGQRCLAVGNLLGFENLVHLGAGEGGLAPEAEVLHVPPVANNHLFQHCTPAGSLIADDPTHRRVAAQLLGVDALVAGQPPKHRLVISIVADLWQHRQERVGRDADLAAERIVELHD
jgi:hypothetical protein